MEKKYKLVIVGDSAFAEIAYEYFTYESEYRVVTFAVEEEFLTRDRLCGLPVVPFGSVEKFYAPGSHSVFVATTYTEKNTLRARLYDGAKQKGYAPASYISSHAFIWQNCRIGEHCFIFENNVIQPFVSIGDNVVVWSANHIGHHSVIRANCFISSHVVISGFVQVGESCFIGVNATVANNITIGNNCVIGAGALVLSDVEDGETIFGTWKKR